MATLVVQVDYQSVSNQWGWEAVDMACGCTVLSGTSMTEDDIDTDVIAVSRTVPAIHMCAPPPADEDPEDQAGCAVLDAFEDRLVTVNESTPVADAQGLVDDIWLWTMAEWQIGLSPEGLATVLRAAARISDDVCVVSTLEGFAEMLSGPRTDGMSW